ncbi:FtsW/RodA/SpoVE family cell cycle protein [bacterium]|nr:FtsW/RodA/SpoVE family cell cycle protein [candidate division CSSED10-310 bacterium]
MVSNADTSRFFRKRPEELHLLIPAFAAVCLMFGAAALSVLSNRPLHLTDGVLPAGYILSVLVAHGILVMLGSRADPVLMPVWILIAGTGMAFQFRLGTIDGISWQNPGCWAFAAAPLVTAVAAVVFGSGRLKSLARLSWIWILAAFGICVAVLATGVSYRGAMYGPAKTTPTEAVKVLLILGISGLLVRYGQSITKGTPLLSADSRRVHIMLIGAWLLPAVVLVLLGDLGMLAGTGLLLGILITMATFRWIYPIAGVAIISLGSWAVRTFIGKGQVRFSAWLNPFENPDTNGFQTIRSLFAIFNGEFLGRGVGNGFPRTIPLVETDFVYASMSEEIGWIGTGLLLILVLILVRRSLKVAGEAKDSFCALVSIGCGAMWLIQVFLHVGGVIKLIPMTGVPFPGLSTGGSAIVVFSVLTGLIMSVSDHPEPPPVKSRNQR